MASTTSESGVKVQPVAGHIGAEISGVNLARPLSDAAIHDIRSALLQWKVVFFRNQNIDHAAQVAFTSRFGQVTYAHPPSLIPPEKVTISSSKAGVTARGTLIKEEKAK